jgi:triosephosphate isomerase
MIKTPVFITNFKNYEQATAQRAVDLAKIHEKVAKDTGVSIAVAVAPADLYRVSQAVSIPVFAQHVDAVDYGSCTGKILPQSVKKNGAIGTLLNHSENRINENILEQTISLAQKTSLMRILCAENPTEVEKFAGFDVDFIAFEPPELIGSSDKSVSSEAPESIIESVKKAKVIPLIVGAGINSAKDVAVALKLGAMGFLVASAIVKADDPEVALKAIVQPMIK